MEKSKKSREKTNRPILFVGSSGEGLKYAKALQVNLDPVCQVSLWTQGVFDLSKGTLENLVEKIQTVDFGVLIVTPDDIIHSRDKKIAGPRDNVILELGICIGALGRDRSFLVCEQTTKIKIPSDLSGITFAAFQPHDDGNDMAALGAATTLIEKRVKEMGGRIKAGRVGLIDQDTQFRIIADTLGVIADNYLIQLLETGKTVQREQGILLSIGGYWYGIEFPGKHIGSGRFSINDLCEKLSEAKIIHQDLKFNVGLTEHGKAFAKWLIANGYKASAFASPLGIWGKLSRVIKDAKKYFEGKIKLE